MPGNPLRPVEYHVEVSLGVSTNQISMPLWSKSQSMGYHRMKADAKKCHRLIPAPQMTHGFHPVRVAVFRRVGERVAPRDGLNGAEASTHPTKTQPAKTAPPRPETEASWWLRPEL